MRTPVCELLGIEQPIVQAPMSAVPGLAAAVSNAGGLGMLALTWSDDAGEVVRETAALTDRPFGGNFILTSDHHRRLDQALGAGLRIASFMWADPAPYVGPVHDAGGVVMHTVGSCRRGEAGGRKWSGRGRRGGLGSRRARVEYGGDTAVGAGCSGRGGPRTGDCGGRDS